MTKLNTNRRVHKYRCTKVVTTDYGQSSNARANEGPCSDITTIAQLSIIPDGSDWQSIPQTIEVSVPQGTKPGAIWTLSLEQSQ